MLSFRLINVVGHIGVSPGVAGRGSSFKGILFYHLVSSSGPISYIYIWPCCPVGSRMSVVRDPEESLVLSQEILGLFP